MARYEDPDNDWPTGFEVELYAMVSRKDGDTIAEHGEEPDCWDVLVKDHQGNGMFEVPVELSFTAYGDAVEFAEELAEKYDTEWEEYGG